MNKLLNSIEQITFDDSPIEGRGRHFSCRFIEPGIVAYNGSGVIKVSKEALDKFINSLVGCPVVIRHHEIDNENVDDLRVGVVSSVFYNPEDGWFYCDGIIWDVEAISKIEQGWSVSCCYIVKQTTGESGEWHNIPFDDELIDGFFEHLAIVPNPRYEEATILLNSKEGRKNMLFKLFNNKKVRNSENEGEEMKKENEESIDKNALKNKIMEHVNKAVKGKGDIDGQSEDSWYEEFREMLDKLAYSDSEEKRSNEKDEEDKEEEKKKNESDASEESDDKKDNEKEEEEKENEEEKDDKEEEKKNRKSNSKESYEEMKRLSNSGSAEIKSGYIPESSRLALGKALF